MSRVCKSLKIVRKQLLLKLGITGWDGNHQRNDQ